MRVLFNCIHSTAHALNPYLAISMFMVDRKNAENLYGGHFSRNISENVTESAPGYHIADLIR